MPDEALGLCEIDHGGGDTCEPRRRETLDGDLPREIGRAALGIDIGSVSTKAALITEVEAQGGMARAIETGMPKMRIEESAARKQARIDRGEEIVVGVNKFQLKEEAPIEILDVDNDMVRESQVTRLTRIRKTRDEAKCVAALKALGDAARNGTGNLLALSIEATRARATVGEISSALEGVYGRYQATIRSISGVYAGEWEGDEGLARIRTYVGKSAWYPTWMHAARAMAEAWDEHAGACEAPVREQTRLTA